MIAWWMRRIGARHDARVVLSTWQRGHDGDEQWVARVILARGVEREGRGSSPWQAIRELERELRS